MSKITTTTAPQPDPPAQPEGTDTVEDQQQPEQPDPPAPSETDLATEVAKWKALARKNEQAAKSNAQKAKEFDEYQASQKTEAEKAQEKIAELSKQVHDQAQAILRSEVAAEKGLEPELAATLAGSTREEMAEHADVLLAAIKRSFAPKHKPDPKDTGAGITDGGDTVAQQIAAAQAKGDFKASLALKNRALMDLARKTT